MKKDTQLVQSGRKDLGNPGIVNTPVYRASTVLFENLGQMQDVQAAWLRDEAAPTYGITNMPNGLALETAVAELEGGYRALSFPSGHAAVAAALLACTKAGDHILVPDSCYGPARHTCTHFLARFGVETEFYDPLVGSEIVELMRDNTSVVYTESPGSHTFEVQDIPAIARVAHAGGAKVIMDNAWATGMYFRAFEHGVDLVVQPATKYLAGHSDVLVGLVVASEATWPLLRDCSRNLGQHVSPDDSFLTLRGLRTLGVRLPRHQETALALTQWLLQRREVKRVLYPALPGDPGYALWKRDFLGASGLFAIELEPCSIQAIAAMLDHYELFALGYSWGGFESLVVPANIAHARSVKPWKGGPLVRYHAGLEDAGDLIRDLEAGFARLGASR
jgi:cystathionine beta-lyase